MIEQSSQNMDMKYISAMRETQQTYIQTDRERDRPDREIEAETI